MAISDKTKKKIIIFSHIIAVIMGLSFAYYPIQTLIAVIIIPLIAFIIKSKW